MLPNIGSARVLEKIGMKYEGNIRKYNHEMKLYAISGEDVRLKQT
jgi:RimJ/RimL family protein N-acetyltransferase